VVSAAPRASGGKPTAVSAEAPRVNEAAHSPCAPIEIPRKLAAGLSPRWRHA